MIYYSDFFKKNPLMRMNQPRTDDTTRAADTIRMPSTVPTFSGVLASHKMRWQAKSIFASAFSTHRIVSLIGSIPPKHLRPKSIRAKL